MVVGHAQAQRLRNAVELVGEGLLHVRCAGRIGVRQFHQDKQAARALDQRTHRAGVARALDEVTLPVPGKHSILDLWRARMDAHHVRNQTAPVLTLASRHPLVVGVTKAVNQVAAQLPHGLGVNTAVDGFC